MCQFAHCFARSNRAVPATDRLTLCEGIVDLRKHALAQVQLLNGCMDRLNGMKASFLPIEGEIPGLVGCVFRQDA